MKDFERDQALDVLLEDAVSEAEEDTPASRPAFADIVARSHQINRRTVPAQAVQRAAQTGGRPTWAGGNPGGPAVDLQDFVDAAHLEARADIERRRAHGVPSRGVDRSRVRVRRWAVAMATVASAAAALLLVVRFGFDGNLARVDNAPPHTQAAAELGQDAAETFRAVERAPVRAPRRLGRRNASTPVIPDEPIPLQAPEEEPEVDPAPLEAPSRPPLGERLRGLDARAERLLAAGDVAGADRLYQRIIAQGGRKARVELAYAERFTIAHRQRQRAKQRKLYRAYLRSFPRGRFSDDARAGLCRTLDDTASSSCWAAYLRDRPKGAYAAEAKRATARGEVPL